MPIFVYNRSMQEKQLADRTIFGTCGQLKYLLFLKYESQLDQLFIRVLLFQIKNNMPYSGPIHQNPHYIFYNYLKIEAKESAQKNQKKSKYNVVKEYQTTVTKQNALKSLLQWFSEIKELYAYIEHENQLGIMLKNGKAYFWLNVNIQVHNKKLSKCFYFQLKEVVQQVKIQQESVEHVKQKQPQQMVDQNEQSQKILQYNLVSPSQVSSTSQIKYSNSMQTGKVKKENIQQIDNQLITKMYQDIGIRQKAIQEFYMKTSQKLERFQQNMKSCLQQINLKIFKVGEDVSKVNLQQSIINQKIKLLEAMSYQKQNHQPPCIKIPKYLFSMSHKSKNILIDNKKIASCLPSNKTYKITLIQPISLNQMLGKQNKIKELKIKIHGLMHYIAIGLCNKQEMQGNNYQFASRFKIPQRFIIDSNGDTWISSHSNSKKNKDFMLKLGDVIKIELVINQNIMRFTKYPGPQTVSLYLGSNIQLDQLSFCAFLSGEGDVIEILDT